MSPPSYSPEFKIPEGEETLHPKIVTTQAAIAKTLDRLSRITATSDAQSSHSHLFVESDLEWLLLAVVRDDWNHEAIAAGIALPCSGDMWRSLPFSGKDVNGVSPLLLAVFLKRHKMVTTLLDTASGGYMLDHSRGTPLLPLAILADDVRIIELILRKKHGAQYLLLEGLSTNLNPVLMSAHEGAVASMECMLNNYRGSGQLLTAIHDAGGLPVYEAVKKKHFEAVQLLIAGYSSGYEGTESLRMRAEGNGTPLIAAVCGGDLRIVKLILAAAEVHYNETNQKEGEFLAHIMAQNFNSLYILCLAAYYKHLLVGVELMMYGADLRQAKASAIHLESPQEINTFLDQIEQAFQVHRESTAKQTIEEIQFELKRGKTARLLQQLKKPATGPTAPWLHRYFKRQALFDLMDGIKLAGTIEWGQGKLFKEAVEALLKAHPTAISQKRDGMTAVDLALQIQPLNEGLISLLQYYENQQRASFGALEKKFKKSRFGRLVAPEYNSLNKELWGKDEATPTIPLEVVNQQFKAQLTGLMVKALAIKCGLLEGHNPDRASTVIEGIISLGAALVPLPGLTIATKGAAAIAKFLIKQAAQSYVKERDKRRHEQRLGGINDGAGLDEAAKRVKTLAEALTRRFQFIAVLLHVDSLPTFVTEVLRCMVKYWDSAMKKSHPYRILAGGSRLSAAGKIPLYNY